MSPDPLTLLPDGPIDVVLDTDTYNEADDQFALSYLFLSPEKLRPAAVYACPFHNSRSSSPEEGMELSYEEILRLLGLLRRDDFTDRVFKGSRRYLPDEHTPVPSEAASDLIARSRAYTKERRLWVVAIGCLTDIASALLMDPTLKDRIALVWLGGHSFLWEDTKEFNMRQDIPAARAALLSGVPFVQLPCRGVVSEFRTTGPELAHWIGGRNPLCDHLIEGMEQKVLRTTQLSAAWSRPIWDVTAVGWLLNAGNRFMKDRFEPAVLPDSSGQYEKTPQDFHIRRVWFIDRDPLMQDLFQKLAAAR